MNQILVNKLIKHYEKTINQIKLYGWFMWIIRSILYSTKTNFGVCYCSYVYGITLPNEWVLSKLEYSTDIRYWYKTPNECNTKVEIIECLQKRIDILKQYPN